MENLDLEMKDKFNVVIVGAGPAGLACARQLKDSEFSVLIIDKNEELGPKICAGGIRVSDLESLGLIPDEIKGCDIISIDDSGQGIDFTTIDRKRLGKEQLKQIENADNINILLGWRVSEILPGKLILGNGKKSRNIFFEYLVGADGSTSKVRHKLGIKTQNKLMLSFIQFDLPVNDITRQFKTLTFFYDKILFGKWYAYIFPHLGLNMARVGCGGSITWLHDEHVKLKQNMDIWLKSMNINVQGAAAKRALINADYQGYDFTTSHLGKVFLCGDAAGFASYLSGEGIHQALVSGSEIGEIILDNNYKSKLLSELIHRKEQDVKSITDHNKKGLQEFFIKIYNRLLN